MKKWLLALSILVSQPAFAQSKEANFALVYAGQWLVYGITQNETISDYGRIKNLIQYPFQPEFDKDHFSYNITKHTLAGNYYYLFYRSRGYDVKEAFKWTFISSLAFEFAVETLTEKPSLQDIYHTPVFGTLSGMTFELVSNGLLSSSSRIVRFFGFVVNPFQLLPTSKTVVAITPLYSNDQRGILVTAEF